MNALILGATRGLGKAITEECQRRNWCTFEVGSSIPFWHSLPGRVLYPCDLANEKDVHIFVNDLVGNLWSFNRFFWVAGQHWGGKFGDQERDDVLRIVDVNLRNPLMIAKQIWRGMYKHRQRDEPFTFTVIASTSGTRPRKNEAVYVATKFAQVGFARSLGLEAEGTNIRVSLFLPGGMNTDMLQNKPTSGGEVLDPNKVAAHIVELVAAQTEPFFEKEIPRGSL